MKNKVFALTCFLLITVLNFNGLASHPAMEKTDAKKKQIYEWRIYTLNNEETKLDQFFKETLIPAYNRQGISVGAFTLYKKGEKELRYLLLVYPDLETFNKVRKDIWKDKTFKEASHPFFDETAPNPAYSGYETFLCEAFDKIPVMRKPDKSRGLFEFRLYHSPNEDANQRKIKMFNAEEIDLFDKVDIHSVCYGDILIGSKMPALIYLTWYKDEPTRNDAWKKFGAHPDWNSMKNKPEYQYTATDNQIILLSPMLYSQF